MPVAENKHPSTDSNSSRSAQNGGSGQQKHGSSRRGGSNKRSGSKSMSDDNASFLRAARGGNLEKVLEYLKASTDINTCNANGLNALHLAAKEGHVSVVTELLSRGAKIDAATKKGNTALHIASLAGQNEVVKILVEHDSSVNVQSQNGFTPLYMAAQENHDEVVRFLLASGANQSLATEDGFTPLAVALQQGHDKVVAVLLENDTRGKVRLPALHIAAKKDDTKAAGLLLQNDHNPDVTSKSGFTPLHIAAHYGNENIAALLLQRNANVNYAAKHNITPIHVAAKWGKANMVALLLDKGANLESKTRDGLTPLHCAARSGHENVVDMMVQRGAPISAKTKNGLAPLHMASQGDHVDASRILLHHKAPVDEVTVDYLTALHVAAHCGHVRVAKLLLDRKADPNSRALNGFTPLHIACKKNRIKVVELLLKYKASIEATTESGLTPLHVASFMGCMNIVIYLIQHQASPDEATVRGETPLHLAARANQTDIIRILLRNGAKVDARARELQTPLHIASRLGNVDIVVLLLQSGAQVDATTKDLYTALHIAAKEGQEEVASVLLDHNASQTATTKKGFTPLHLAAKYGNINVTNLLLQRQAPVDAEGKNGVTPLHVAAHYDHQNVAQLLLDQKASPHAAAKNGYTPLHITAKKNQLDIASSLLEFGAKTDAESKAGFTPLHLAAQEGHVDMTNLLMKNDADSNAKAKNGLAPMHLCAQEDRVNVAAILASNGSELDSETKAGYTPLHVACHFGSLSMVRFLLLDHQTEEGKPVVRVDVQNELGYTPLHQAAQQGHSQIVNLLLENEASPNTVSNNGQTALSIAQRLGYISVVETLKVVTEKEITTTTTTTIEEKYKVLAPESMQETFMSDSEDEGGEDILDSAVYSRGENTNGYANGVPANGQRSDMSSPIVPEYGAGNLGEETQQESYKYLTVDEMKSLGDDSMPIDVTHDEGMKKSMERATEYPTQQKISSLSSAPPGLEEKLAQMEKNQFNVQAANEYNMQHAPDNVEVTNRHPISIGNNTLSPDNRSLHSVATSVGNRSITSMWRERFLVSFMVDARGGAMRGCRHSGVRVIIPPRKAAAPMRITCRYLKKDKLVHPPPLMEGEAVASRILELGPSGAKFLGPVIIEVPHFAALRGKEREIVILRSDNGETWREHTLEATEDAVQEVLQESFDADEMSQLEDLNTNRITRILTTDFPQYFAIVSRIRQEVHAIGPEGGVVNSTVVPQVQAVFPQGALTKKIKVGLQAQPIPPELAAKLLGNRVAVSPIVTVEPRRRKFHKPISLTIPVPIAAGKGMINQYNNTDGTPTLRLLCSITGGTTRAQWEDVTGSTPLTFVNDCVNFTTTVSARFWLMDCRNIEEATKMATELYREAIHAPFMAKFVIFSKRHEVLEARLRVFCMTDDKEDKTLEQQEHFTEVAKSRDVEVLEGKSHFIEFGGNLVPITKSGDQLSLRFFAFRENRIPFNVKVKDPHSEPMGRVAFMKEPKGSRGDAPQTPICNLNVALPDNITPDVPGIGDADSLAAIQNKYSFLRDQGYGKFDTIHRADLRISDIGNLVGSDWVKLAHELDISDSDINIVMSEYPDSDGQQAIVMLRLWLSTQGNQATGNALEKALRRIGREDVVNKCMFNVELVTDEKEQSVAKTALEDLSGFDAFKAELGPSRNSTLKRVDENGEQEEVEEKFMAEERITEKEEFTPQQYTHQSIVVTQATDDLAEVAADDDDNTATTETTTQESIIKKTTTRTSTSSYSTNVNENIQQFDNKFEEEPEEVQDRKPEFEREHSPELIEPQIMEPQVIACTFGREEEPNVEVVREESSNVTTTDDGTEIFTQTRKTTVTTTTISEEPHDFGTSYPGEDVVDTVYEREEQKYVAEEKDFTQPQFFVAEEVKDFSQLEQQPIVEETLIETKVVDSNLAEPIIQREDVSEYRETPWKEEVSHETMRQVSETIVSEETRKISTSSSSSSSDDDQAGVRSKEIRHHYEEETNEITEQVIEESEDDVAMRMRAALSTSTPPSSPAVLLGEKTQEEQVTSELNQISESSNISTSETKSSSSSVVATTTTSSVVVKQDAETSLAEAAVLAQHEQHDEKHDEEKRGRKASTSSASSHASSTSSKASSTKGYPVKDEIDDDEEMSKEHDDEMTDEPRGLSALVDEEIKQPKLQHAQSSSYDDTATTSSEIDAKGDIPSAGKRSRTSSSSSSKSSNSSKGSKHSVGSSRGSSRGSTKSNLDEEGVPETMPSAVTAEEVVEQELLDEMIVKDDADNFGTDPGVAIVLTAPEVINEEEETSEEDTPKKQKGDLSDHGHSESDDVTSSNEDIANQPKQGSGNDEK